MEKQRIIILGKIELPSTNKQLLCMRCNAPIGKYDKQYDSLPYLKNNKVTVDCICESCYHSETDEFIEN